MRLSAQNRSESGGIKEENSQKRKKHERHKQMLRKEYSNENIKSSLHNPQSYI